MLTLTNTVSMSDLYIILAHPTDKKFHSGTNNVSYSNFTYLHFFSIFLQSAYKRDSRFLTQLLLIIIDGQ